MGLVDPVWQGDLSELCERLSGIRILGVTKLCRDKTVFAFDFSDTRSGYLYQDGTSEVVDPSGLSLKSDCRLYRDLMRRWFRDHGHEPGMPTRFSGAFRYEIG